MVMSQHLTIMGERSHYRVGREDDSRETEKLLEEVEDDRESEEKLLQTCTDATPSTWDDSTLGSVVRPSKSENRSTSIIEDNRTRDNKKSNKSLIRNLNFYRRSSDGKGDRVTPFAVVLLLVLLAVYVLNQADRLVLPVVIPNGLRCNVGKDDCSGLNTTNTSTDGNDTTNNTSSNSDCIQFNDDQQGLLTGG